MWDQWQQIEAQLIKDDGAEQTKEIRMFDYMDNLLLLNMIQLYAFMVKYQVFNVIGEPGHRIQIYEEIFPYLITFMEYKNTSPKLSFAIRMTRCKTP